jgi:hypothetical protein
MDVVSSLDPAGEFCATNLTDHIKITIYHWLLETACYSNRKKLLLLL